MTLWSSVKHVGTAVIQVISLIGSWVPMGMGMVTKSAQWPTATVAAPVSRSTPPVEKIGMLIDPLLLCVAIVHPLAYT